ncbi:MAG: DUF4292 domain-containing protein [Flavobacterium sp.]|nr:MAG: DUF4292 domain-containing protein [Flavobacterium sp.]
MKYLTGVLALIFLVSCKSKAVLAEGKAKDEITPAQIIQNHYANKQDFKTLYIRSSARYEDKDNTQNVNAEIKIKKDEKILISIRVLGITMAKALITPESVRYYEKINGEYFEGDYTSLSRWLGTDLDFKKVQNLFLGQAMDDLSQNSYQTTIENNLYKLFTAKGGIDKAFFFESKRFLLKRQEIGQAEKSRKLSVDYLNFSDYPQAALPSGIDIEATQPKGKVTINVEYNAATFNEELSFPYSVPDGYERIFIK